jgi:DNA-directed RNA polymerase subunit beta'
VAYLSPEESFNALKENTVQALKEVFPIKGSKQTLLAKNIRVVDNKGHDDIRSQLKAKEEGRSWDVPVEADLHLIDNATGKVIDTQKKRLMNLPKTTNRLGYILDGKEYQVDSLWRLKPGPYSRINEKGDLETRFNLKGRNQFHIDFNPEKAKFSLRHGTSNYELYPFAKALGISDTELEKHWGKDVLAANKNVDVEKELAKFQSRVGRRDELKDSPTKFVQSFFRSGEMDPHVTKTTLGVSKTSVDGEALALGAGKLIKINKGEVHTDDRDDLAFKELHSLEDFTKESIKKRSRDIIRKLTLNVNRKDKIKDILSSELFTKPVRSIFVESSLGNHPEQVNPIEIFNNATKTTFLGEFGGIKSENSIPSDTKLVNPSHFGFLDPLITPESGRAGVSLHLPLGVQKVGNKVVTTLYNLKTKKMEQVDPVTALQSHVVLPDQIRWEKGKPVPLKSTVRMNIKGNELSEGKFEDAHYVIPSSAQLFGASTNLVPFMATTSPNRTTMAGRHMSQAIPLVHRENRMTESVIDKNTPGSSIQDYLGKFSSHVSPVDGTIHKINHDSIVVKDEKGKSHEVQIYKDFPLNDEKSYVTATPSVKVGDKVKTNQVIADTNFTKNGKLALGTHLYTAQMPWKGRNFEDGVVISADAAKKLTSMHMHRKSVEDDPNVELNLNRFVSHAPTVLTREQMGKLDDTGVVKVGTQVHPGDTLIAAVRRREDTHEDNTIRMRVSKKLAKLYDPIPVKWESDHIGTVEKVIRKGGKTEVYVKTHEPAIVGDKISGSFGDKGIITEILPTHEMPKNKDGRHVDLLVNPQGVPGRINLGQILETASNKIAEKTGKNYVVQNFDGAENLTEQVKTDLEKHGLTDKEDLIDPKTGQVISNVLVGPRYIHKLKHQIVKKETARAGGAGYVYDAQKIPKRGGPQGAQSLEQLSLYALLAHGSTSNIRDAVTYKSDAANNDLAWKSIQSGLPLPPPRPTFAYEKFNGMLKSMGVNTVKQGNSLLLQPLTDKELLTNLSNGELKDAGKMIEARRWIPEKTGLYDPEITGGFAGDKWSHIKLPHKMPNPIFEKSILALTGFKGEDFDELMRGHKALDPATKTLVPSTEKNTLIGGHAVEHLLSGMDVKKELASTLKSLENPKLRGKALNDLNKKAKYLRALENAGLTPVEAYMQQHIAVMPPNMRPPAVLPNGNFIKDDINQHYKNIALASRAIEEANKHTIEDLPEMKAKRVGDLYDSMKALSGLGTVPGNTYKGIVDVISGKSYNKEGEKGGKPGEGYFQGKLVKKRQDLSMRSTIIPEPEMGLDEIGLPKQSALEIYKPFVVQHLRQVVGMTPLSAKKEVDKQSDLAVKALEVVANERPVLVKRDPVLHKYGIQAFKPRIVDGKAIKIHPLVCGPYNADFDGDAMAAFVPLSHDSVAEARKMFPSNNIFSSAAGEVMFHPTNESRLGLYMLNREGDKKNLKFDNISSAAQAVKDGKIGYTDVITLGGIRTTLGRAMTAKVLPSAYQEEILHGKKSLTGDVQVELLAKIGKSHKNDFGKVVNDLKDLGNTYITYNPVSIGLRDIAPLTHVRDSVLHEADKEVKEVKKKGLSLHAELKEVVSIYDKAGVKVQDHLKKSIPELDSSLTHMLNAGVKPNLDTFRQIKVAPLLMANAKGEVIPSPIRKSYAEGLDSGDYWTSMSGARKGIIQKVQSVRDPGYLTKQIMNTVMSNIISTPDCGTKKGISLDIHEKDILDRFLAVDTKSGSRTIKAGTLITPEVRDSFRNNGIKKVVVRSPLRCEHAEGLCAKCHGLDEEGKLPEFGRNVGIQAGQALGERSTQLAMKSFHSGGVVAVGKATSGSGGVVDRFDRVQQLLRMPQHVPDSAPLAKVSGEVTKIEKHPAGGHNIFIGGQKHYVNSKNGDPLFFSSSGHRPLEVGDSVSKGVPLASGPINPSEMLPLAGIHKVQNYLTGEIHELYKGEGIRRRNVEVVVKSLTNVSQVKDPGDSEHYLHGDIVPTSRAMAKNKELIKLGKRPAELTPIIKGVGMIPLAVQQDYLANLNHQRIKDTLVDAANQGWHSDIHGHHPIPGIVYGAEFGKGKPY